MKQTLLIISAAVVILAVLSTKSCVDEIQQKTIAERQQVLDSLSGVMSQYDSIGTAYQNQIDTLEKSVTKHKAQLAEQKAIIKNLRSIVVAKRGNEQLMEYIFQRYSDIVDTLPIKNPTLNLPVAVVTQMVQDAEQKDLCSQENYHLDSALDVAVIIMNSQDSIKIVYEASLNNCNQELALCKAIKDTQLLQIKDLREDVAKKEKKTNFFRHLTYILGAGLAGSMATQFLSKPND